MKNLGNRLTADVIGSALSSWTDYLEQVCPVGITPSFVMDQTARAGP